MKNKMITVQVNINGNCLVARSCHRIKTGKIINIYKTDCGKIIKHKSKDGAIKLAYKLLDCIEVGDNCGKRNDVNPNQPDLPVGWFTFKTGTKPNKMFKPVRTNHACSVECGKGLWDKL